jgi:hypothetical protein
VTPETRKNAVWREYHPGKFMAGLPFFFEPKRPSASRTVPAQASAEFAPSRVGWRVRQCAYGGVIVWAGLALLPHPL